MDRHSTTIYPEQHERAEREHPREHVKHSALLARVALRERVAERQEHEADEEVRDPCMRGSAQRTSSDAGSFSQFSDSPTEESAETAWEEPSVQLWRGK